MELDVVNWDLKEDETMYEVIKSYISTCGYDLAEMVDKIDAMWVRSRLTEDEHTELLQMAREHAEAKDSMAPLAERVASLEMSLADAMERIDALEAARGDAGDEATDESDEGDAAAWPEYVQPTGAHDAYKAGDRVAYRGSNYTCKMDNCVWAPDVYPAAWETA